MFSSTHFKHTKAPRLPQTATTQIQSLSLHAEADQESVSVPSVHVAPKSKQAHREPIPCDQGEHPMELAFLEELSQTAFDTHSDSMWQNRNPDFSFCSTHARVCELFQNATQNYHICTKCSDKSFADVPDGLYTTFFPTNDTNDNPAAAQHAWEVAYKEKEMYYRKETNKDNPTIDRREKFTWIRYYFINWAINTKRIEIMKDHARGMSIGFDSLSSHPDPALVKFHDDRSIRHMQTTAGKQGANCNEYMCATHEAKGHAIQIFNKMRYKECGISVMPREQSQLQRAFEIYNNQTL